MKEKAKSKRVGEQIRLIRLEKNLSQEALADEFDLSVSTLSNLERGATEFTISRLYSLLDYLNINIIDFFAKIEKVNISQANISDFPKHTKQKQIKKNSEDEIRFIKSELENLKAKNK